MVSRLYHALGYHGVQTFLDLKPARDVSPDKIAKTLKKFDSYTSAITESDKKKAGFGYVMRMKPACILQVLCEVLACIPLA